jgi:hypothetical protein
MNTTAGTAALIRSYRETVAADPEMHDGDLDVTYWLVNESSRSWTPSEVARALNTDTWIARQYLSSLAADGLIAADERGAWTRYFAA